jgi:TPR repeat protein
MSVEASTEDQLNFIKTILKKNRIYYENISDTKSIAKIYDLFKNDIIDESVSDAIILLYYGFYHGIKNDCDRHISYLKKAVELNNARAMNLLGVNYQTGYGVPLDMKLGLEWYQKSADLGHMLAMYNLGDCYKYGYGVIINDDIAAQWYQKSAELGYDPAQYTLAECYFNGVGVNKDPKKAFELYKKLSDTDEYKADAMNEVGNCYYEGIGVEKNLEEALNCYNKSAVSGSVLALKNLANYYYNLEEYDKSLNFLLKATEMKDTEAMYYLAYFYLHGYAVKKDEEKAVELLQELVPTNNTNAINELGNCYYYGSGVKKDVEEALKLYHKAADLGFSIANLNLSDHYHKTNEIKSDYYLQQAIEQGNCEALNVSAQHCYDKKEYNKAIELWIKCANLDDANAMNSLGICYCDGVSVVEDQDEGLMWYLKAASLDHECATCNIGYLYYHNQEYKQAIEWFLKLDKKKVHYCAHKLAECYMLGNGVDIDINKAVGYLQKGANTGNTTCMFDLSQYYISIEDNASAFYWLKEAAELKNDTAMNSLGKYYLNEKDYIEAMKWFSALEDRKAKKNLQNMFVENIDELTDIIVDMYAQNKELQELITHLELYPGTDFDQAIQDFNL